jgi:hypothetical protein
MNKPLVIMFDIDGVLADFVLGFTSRAAEIFNVQPRTTTDVQSWHLEEVMTREQLNFVLKLIERSPSFWYDLPVAPQVSPEDFGRINILGIHHRVYFVTSRIESGNTIQQTRLWLSKCGIVYPNVVMSKKKGEFARAVGADYSIEDKWDNAHCIHWFSDSPQIKSYLIDRPYNHVSNIVGAQRVRRISTVKEYLDDIEARA